jgi:hypothetical protein
LIAIRRVPAFTRVAGALALALGGATLSQHLAGWDLGIDQLLFTEPPGAAATASPNRMGLNASISFVLLGSALALLAAGTARSIRWAQSLAALALVPATLAIVGYGYGTEQLYGIAQYTGIALHTAVALGLLAAGTLAARIDSGPMSLLVSGGSAGTLLRRLLLPIFLLPVGLGYLVVLARQAGVFDLGLATALLVVTLIVSLCVVT